MHVVPIISSRSSGNDEADAPNFYKSLKKCLPDTTCIVIHVACFNFKF